MTLAMAAWCKNGVAMSADSRTSFPDASTGIMRTATDAAEKLFPVGRCGVVTAGFADLNGRTIFSHMRDFAQSYTAEPPSVIARDLAKRFKQLYDEHVATSPQSRVQENQAAVEFLVGGYEGDEPACYRVYVTEQKPGAKLQLPAARGMIEIADGMGHWRLDGDFNYAWIGEGDIVSCLVHGYNTYMFGRNTALDAANRVIPIGMFSLQDCVDFIHFLTEASERMKHFSAGDASKIAANRTVGGPIDIAVIRRQSGFEYVKKKELVVQPQLTSPPTVEDET